jgi:phosphatidylinositol alpha-1,6-mannosyltransferase
MVSVVHGTPGARVRTAINQMRAGNGRLRSLALLAWMAYSYPGRRRAFVERADRVIAVSEDLRSRVVREYAVKPEKVLVVPNGIDTELFAPSLSRREETRRVLGLKPSQHVLLVVSRLVPEKGIHLAIRGLARLRREDVTLMIAGSGSDEARLQELATSLGVSRSVCFCGFVPHGKLPSYLNAADVFLMPTLCHEAFPMTLVEAMACGLPVVATDVGGISTAIDNGADGLLFPMGNVDALVHHVERLLGTKDLAHSTGRAARVKATERFSVDVMVRDTLCVFQEALQATRR